MISALTQAVPVRTTERTTRVVVAAGPQLACESLIALFSTEDGIHAIAGPGSIATAEAAVRDLAPDVIVFDPRATGDLDLSMLESLRSVAVPPAVVALVGDNDHRLVVRMVSAGAAGAIVKTAASAELVLAVRSAANGDGWISPVLLRNVLTEIRTAPTHDDRIARLTRREREILQFMVDGLSPSQMASRLVLSRQTVRSHVRTIIEKVNVHSAPAAVSAALEAGLRPCVDASHDDPYR